MINVFEMFAGSGGASFGLKEANIPHEVIGFSEWDKFASLAYVQNHGPIHNYGDCTKIDPHSLPDFDLLTGGFPCQAFSLAGLKKGTDDPRGLLFNDIIRIAEVKRPKYMLLENVKGLTTKKFADFFQHTKDELTRLGYTFEVQIYKSSDYGTPQTRERVFYICQLEGFDYKGIKPKPLMYTPADLIGEEPEGSKYYRSERLCKWVLDRRSRTSFAKSMNDYVDSGRPVPTLTASKSWLDNHVYTDTYGMRHLTPTECFRFMGFFNDQIKLEGISDSQKYKIVGNGWDINLVKQIFEAWFK